MSDGELTFSGNTYCGRCGKLLELCSCSKPDLARFTQPWTERVTEQKHFGLMLGTLIGLRYRVDDETKVIIDNVLQEVQPPPPL